MALNKIYLLVCFILFSLVRVYGFERTDSLYKVLKIKVMGDYYVVYAQRNGSLFKIISKKVLPNNTQNLQLLKTGQSYYFDFRASDGALLGIINYLHVKSDHVFVDGDTRIKYGKRFHYRLYTTRNLIGLYYSPPTSASSP